MKLHRVRPHERKQKDTSLQAIKRQRQAAAKPAAAPRSACGWVSAPATGAWTPGTKALVARRPEPRAIAATVVRAGMVGERRWGKEVTEGAWREEIGRAHV